MTKLALVLLFAVPFVALAQQTAIQGTVQDASGAVIPNATVRAQSAGGRAFNTTSGAAGAYVFPALEAGEYKVRAQAQGFAPAERTVVLLVGQVVTGDFSLRPATASETVEVVESAATIDVSSSQVGGNVDTRRMTETPLNGRNWMELAMLVPGVTANAVSTVPLGSVSQGKYQINVDGQQVTQNAAGAGFGQPQYSREALAEFQVITNRFDATLGRSSQLQVNAQSKSGTNKLHGSAYGYFRSDSLNAADPIGQRILPYSDKQYGGTVGGPLKTDKLFFFAAYEGEKQPSTVIMNPIGFNQTFSFGNDFSTQTWLTRVDWQASSSIKLSLRLNGAQWRNPFGNIDGSSHPSRAANQTRDGMGAVFNMNWSIKPTFLNEIKYGYNYFEWTNNQLVNSIEMRFPGITIGGPYNYPQIFDQHTNQVRDDMYWYRGKHSVRAGAEYLANNHTGYFQQNVRGLANPISSYPANIAQLIPVWNDPTTWNFGAIAPLVTSYTQGFGDFTVDIPRNIVAFWLQDDWKLNQRLTVNLGVRYDNDIGIWYTVPLKTGILPARGGENKNFAPRIGFAYDLRGDRKTVIRGGTGLYYADIQANQVIDQQVFNGERSIQAAVNRTATQNIDLAKPFGALTGADFISGKVVAPLQNIQILAPGAQTPYSFQMSLGAEHQFGKGWTFSGDFVTWRVYHEWQRQDRNLFFDPATGFGKNPSTSARPDTRYSQILQFATPRSAGAIYKGGQFSLNRRLGSRYQLGSAWTFAKLRDSSVGAFNYPNNQYDLNDEWAQSVDDQRTTIAFDGSAKLPWGFSFSMFYHFGSGNAFAETAPGNPFNYVGASNRTFLSTTRVFIDPRFQHASIAPGFTTLDRNAFRGQHINRVDMRLSKSISIKERYKITGIFESFNTLNGQNYGTYQLATGSSTYGRPAFNSNLAYAARMLQMAVRFDF